MPQIPILVLNLPVFAPLEAGCSMWFSMWHHVLCEGEAQVRIDRNSGRNRQASASLQSAYLLSFTVLNIRER